MRNGYLLAGVISLMFLSGCGSFGFAGGGIWLMPVPPTPVQRAAAQANLKTVIEAEVTITGMQAPDNFSVRDETKIRDAAYALTAVVAQGSVHAVNIRVNIMNTVTNMREGIQLVGRFGGDGVANQEDGTRALLNQSVDESIIVLAGGKGHSYSGQRVSRDGGAGGSAIAYITGPTRMNGHANLILTFARHGGNGSKLGVFFGTPPAGLPRGRRGGHGGFARVTIGGNNKVSVRAGNGGDGGKGASGFIDPAGKGGNGGPGGDASANGGPRNIVLAAVGNGGSGGKGGTSRAQNGTGGPGGAGTYGGNVSGALGSGSTVNGHGTGSGQGSWPNGSSGGAGQGGTGPTTGATGAVDPPIPTTPSTSVTIAP
jgi:hypothetical protein